MTGPDGAGLGPRLREMWRAVRVDVIGFVVIAIAMVVLRREALRHGMCFNDPTWYFHFGNRTLHGAVPYRDYIFQVGPLPIYVDAAFQKIYGETYVASQYAALFVAIVRVSIMWALARRIVSWRAAVGVAVFCAIDPVFSFAHHWSTPYAQLFITLGGLLFVLASRADGRRALIYLGLAGASIALVVSARQASATVIGMAVFIASAVLMIRRDDITPRRFVALWLGFAAGIIAVLAALALVGALGPALQQMFLDAPQKKSVHGITALLDAISGGALVYGGSYSWWQGLLEFLGIPIVIVAMIAYVASRDRPISTGTVAMLVLPVGIFVGLATRDAPLNYLSDLPRTFLSMIALIVLLSPDRLRRWVGLSPLVAIGLAVVPLASDAALELSVPGRGWGDTTSLVTGTLLVTLASSHLSGRLKTVLCSALAVLGLAHMGVTIRYGMNSFALAVASEGTLAANNVSSKNPRLRGMRISLARKTALDWLMAEVKPGSTCFVYGNIPVLYTLLDCRNLTRVDTTAADFITGDDAEVAIATMRANPPDFIIAQEQQWMSPPLTLELPADPDRYGGLNARASMAMHQGLRSLLDGYEVVGYVGDVLGPELVKVSSAQFDIIDATRVYRRKR